MKVGASVVVVGQYTALVYLNEPSQPHNRIEVVQGSHNVQGDLFESDVVLGTDTDGKQLATITAHGVTITVKVFHPIGEGGNTRQLGSVKWKSDDGLLDSSKVTGNINGYVQPTNYRLDVVA